MRGDDRVRGEASPTVERAARQQRQGNDQTMTARAAAAAAAEGPLSADGVMLLQRAAGNAAVASALDGLDGSLVHSVIGGGGSPLDRPLQTAMESHFGVDLSDVRIHTDERASRSAQAINAQAYTAGSHVVFQRQHFQPGTESGLHMLAHELTHVVQQRSGPVDGTPVAGGVNVSDPSDRFEQAADRSADSVVRALGGVGGLRRAASTEEEL